MLKYFSQPGFGRLFREIRRKYESLGRIGGRVVLRKLNPEEREVLGSFLGRDLRPDSGPRLDSGLRPESGPRPEYAQLSSSVQRPDSAQRSDSGVSVSLSEVDRILRESRFELGLADFLTQYFGGELKSNQELAREQQEQWEQFFREALPLAVREKTVEWVRTLQDGSGSGYRILLSSYQADRTEALLLLQTCIKALDGLPAWTGDRCRRPVFAARLTGNPHGLDRGTALGRLVYAGMEAVLEEAPVPGHVLEPGRALGQTPGEVPDRTRNILEQELELEPEPEPGRESDGSDEERTHTGANSLTDATASATTSAYTTTSAYATTSTATLPGAPAANRSTDIRPAEKMRAVFRQAGLEEDDLSSNVIVAGLQTKPTDDRYALFANSTQTGDPLILPLRFFDRTTDWLNVKAVYVVENPTVLSAILDAWEGPGFPPIVCPSGQPSVAALHLLDELVSVGVKIYYSGDFDGKGLEIGVGLWKRYPDNFVPWLFNSLTYQAAPAGTRLSEEQRKRISALDIPWDWGLQTALLQRGFVVFQEVLVEEMLRDLKISRN